MNSPLWKDCSDPCTQVSCHWESLASATLLRLATACMACCPDLRTAGTGPTVRLAQWLPCGLAPRLHGSPASLARPHVPPSHSLRFSYQMAALICATVTGDAHWVRTAGSVSARPAGEGPDATLPWKPPVPITRIMREVSKHLLVPSPSRVERWICFRHELLSLERPPLYCCQMSPHFL